MYMSMTIRLAVRSRDDSSYFMRKPLTAAERGNFLGTAVPGPLRAVQQGGSL